MVPNFAPLSAFDLKMKIERQVRFSIALPNVFFKLVKQPIAKNAFWSKNFDFSKNSPNFFWVVLIVETHTLGSGGCFGTTLDHLGWIRSILRQIKKIMFETSFYLIFAAKFLNGMVLTCNVFIGQHLVNIVEECIIHQNERIFQ